MTVRAARPATAEAPGKKPRPGGRTFLPAVECLEIGRAATHSPMP